MPISASRARLRLPATLALMGLVLLSACGGGDDDERGNGWLGAAGLQRSAPAGDAAAPQPAEPESSASN